MPPWGWSRRRSTRSPTGPEKLQFLGHLRRRLTQSNGGNKAVAVHGTAPECWLLVEWPAGEDEPTDYWLSTLPETTPIEQLVRLGKIRWRIEHDYRELKHGLGLDHFEGRHWLGWHHHTTPVTAAHLFITMKRLAAGPKALPAA
ncbi:transposase [Corynebacterium sanguinis]